MESSAIPIMLHTVSEYDESPRLIGKLKGLTVKDGTIVAKCNIKRIASLYLNKGSEIKLYPVLAHFETRTVLLRLDAIAPYIETNNDNCTSKGNRRLSAIEG